MSGRRLYELVTDAAGDAGTYARTYTTGALRGDALPAWAFLSAAERAIWSRAAARITPARAAR